MNYFFALLPVIIIFTVLIVCLILNSFFNPLKKMMQELAGQVNVKGEGILSMEGRSVSIKYIPGSRNRRPEFRMFTAGSFGADLVIRRETGLDTFFMKIGLNKEVPILDRELADKFYFECDVPEFLQQFFSNSEMKPLVLDILEAFDFIEITKNGCTFRKYPCGALENISLEPPSGSAGSPANPDLTGIFLKYAGKGSENISKDFVMASAGKLLKFVSCIPQTFIEPHPELAAFKVWRAVLYAIGTVAMISGIVFLMWASASFRVVDEFKAWSLTAELFCAIFFGASYLAFLVIRGFSTSARVFIYFLVSFGIGSLLCLRYGGAVYNGFFDTSPIKQFEQTIVYKYTSTGKHSTYYHLDVSPWREGMKGWSFQVSRGTYNQVRINQTHCLIATKSGCLGFEWVVFQKVGLASWQNWLPRDYSRWNPLPGNINNMDPEEYSYWQKWHVIMEEGITNRMNVQDALDQGHAKEEYTKIFNEYEGRQEKMLDKFRDLDVPQRFQPMKDDVLSAGDDQIQFYREYAQARAWKNDSKLNEFMNDIHLRSSDQKLHDAANYFKSLYPSIDRATHDAIERRLAWFDII
jgi:hypothetical protein